MTYKIYLHERPSWLHFSPKQMTGSWHFRYGNWVHGTVVTAAFKLSAECHDICCWADCNGRRPGAKLYLYLFLICVVMGNHNPYRLTRIPERWRKFLSIKREKAGYSIQPGWNGFNCACYQQFRMASEAVEGRFKRPTCIQLVTLCFDTYWRQNGILSAWNNILNGITCAINVKITFRSPFPTVACAVSS